MAALARREAAVNMIDLLSAFMEREFGSAELACAQLKALVNEALDQGEWHDGFDVAVKKGELDRGECAELWNVVRRDDPEAMLRIAELVAAVKRHLESGSSLDMPIEWLLADDGSLILTEGLRVARFVDGSLAWVTKRVSWDGIHLKAIANGEVQGETYYPSLEGDDWRPLRLAFADGALLEGEEIEFGS